MLLLKHVSVGVNLEFAGVVCALECSDMHYTPDCTRCVLPVVNENILRSKSGLISRLWTDHVADVTRGILSSSAILDSSIGTLDNLPGSSKDSSVIAAIVAFLTSPPKYRERSHK